MKYPNSIDTALTEAEQTCHRRLCEILGLTDGVDAFISVNGGKVECAVFDIGSPWTGDVMAFPSNTFHFRAQCDLYSRNRKTIQKWIMRILYSMPIAPTQSQSNDLDPNSNVSIFRVVPDSSAVSPITTTELKYAAQEKGITAFTATVMFDVVFCIGERK